jgi:hypothetical protein
MALVLNLAESFLEAFSFFEELKVNTLKIDSAKLKT